MSLSPCATPLLATHARVLPLYRARSKARTANFGLRGVFEREFWTNTPGELALVWDAQSKQ